MKTQKIGFIKKAAVITTVALATLLGGFLSGCKSDRDHTPTTIEQPIPIPSTSQRQELEESLLEHYGTLTKNQEPHLLQDHIMDEYATEGDGFVTATQTLEFGTLTPKMEKDALGNVDVFMHAPANTELYTWKSEFTDGFTSRISNSRLTDLIQQDINIGGKNYRVTDATTQWLGGDLDEVTIDMLTGKVAIALNETESSVLRVDGLDYDVEVVSTYTDTNGNSSARFQVNGEMTSNLFSGDTFTLANGQQIGVYTAGSGWVEFGLGVQSLRIKDTDINDDASEGNVSGSGIFGSYGNNSQSKAKIKGSVDTANNTLTLDSIAITLMSNAAQGVFVDKAHILSEALDKPGAAIIDVAFNGMLRKKEETPGVLVNREYSDINFIYTTSGTDSSYTLDFTNKENIAYTNVPLVSNDGSALKKELITTEGSSETDHNIATGNRFVVTGSSDFTHILTYDSWDATERKL
ncbi:hypothetical protein KY315_03830, partial [Candidatus Woesearchaeota archaeon]|nr:hypothetical protein [Candidatus Woesearchaeota archaeon]